VGTRKGGLTEGDVEDEEGVGIADRRRAGAPEARHLAGGGGGGRRAGRSGSCDVASGGRGGAGGDERRDVAEDATLGGWPEKLQSADDPSRIAGTRHDGEHVGLAVSAGP
jgi:hypothetical protein